MIWFTADEHYDHRNIIDYCNRPFKNTWEMRDALIAAHNDRVAKGDLVYHLGDMFWRTLTLKEALDIRYALNGNHYYIMGNHDELMEEKGGLQTALRASFVWVKDVAEIKSKAQYPKIWLSHYAHRVWPGSHRGSYHLYGHSHAELPEQYLSFDVGVDAQNYAPISIEEVHAKMQEKSKAGVTHAVADQMVKHVWPKYAGMAQSEQQRTCNAPHAGSNPAPRSSQTVQVESELTCKIADENTDGQYYCTRTKGHEPPCAAVPRMTAFQKALLEDFDRGWDKNGGNSVTQADGYGDLAHLPEGSY